MAVPAFAVDANGNEFFSPLDYGKIISSSNSSNIIYTVSTPYDWILTDARNNVDVSHEWSYPIGKYTGQSVDFWYTGESINLLLKPWNGDNLAPGRVGSQVLNGHFVDFTYFPDNTIFSGGFDVTVFSGGDVGYKAECWFILHFVDSNGVVVYSYYRRFDYEIVNYTQNTVTFRYDQSINFADLDVPDNAVGMLPIYTLKHLNVNDNYEIIVDYNAPCFEFEMDALEMEAHNNSQLQYTIKAVQELQKQVEQQGQAFDQIINGEPDPVAPEGSDAVEDLNGVENQLKNDSQQGLDEGLGFLQNALGIITQYGSAFLCVIALFRPFAELPLFSALLIISLGLSVCAIVLNIGLDVGRKSSSKTSNKSNRKGG